MEADNIPIAAIQETKLTKNSKPFKTPNYTLVRKDRGTNKGGGLAFLVHKDLNFSLEPTPNRLEQDPFLESMTISLPGADNKPLYIRNVYIPPHSSCEAQYVPPLDHLFDGLGESYMILGDVNAHSQLWHSEATNDPRGNALADIISNRSCGVINEDLPTRVTDLASTAPDISIVSSNLIPCSTWKIANKMSSDHLPITISITAELKQSNAKDITFINYSKANWSSFNKYVENKFKRCRRINNVHNAEIYFRHTLQKAAKKYIPAGRIPKTYNALPTEAARLISDRDNIRQQNPADPRIPELNRDITQKIREHRKAKWEEHLSGCLPGSKKLWSTIKSLNNQPHQPNNQGISFNNKTSNCAKSMANSFNKQYTPHSETKPAKTLRPTLRSLKRKTKDPPVIFTPAQVLATIKKSKSSKAHGPDGLSPVMLKHIGPNAINYLTNLFNECLLKSIIPNIWKTGKIIPLLKPGKPADKGPSYRPVSLLSPAIKILEALLLPAVTEAVQLADHQHGFRKGRSTGTALQSILDHINNGLNRKKPVHRTVNVAIDLSRAFDTVDHTILLQDIDKLDLNDHIKRFLCAYIRGRHTYVLFRNSTSKYRKMKQGVPQGGVLSPILFNLYMSSMPSPPGNIVLKTYADDSNILNSGPVIEPVVEELNSYLATLNIWFKNRNLHISPAKSSATLFTTASNECNLELAIEIDGEKVPTVKKPKFLGVTFDNLLSFKQHASDIKTKVQTKTNVLKALAGSDWGKEKETIVNTYKAIGRPLLNYCCNIWTPALSNTSWKGLQVAQNAALRTATGCHLMTNEDHLHTETKVMKVRPHCEMLSKQFLLATQKPHHPNRVNLSRPPPPRQMEQTLSSRFGAEIRQMSRPDLPEDEFKSKLKIIHTKSVREALNNMEPNKVLQSAPPPINVSEKDLPRHTRATLAQLRSGYSKYLNSYKARLNPTIVDTCPNCNNHSHTTQHLFTCPSNVTELAVTDLWHRPKEAARFLNLATEVNDDNG
jgi:hypothetical protein